MLYVVGKDQTERLPSGRVGRETQSTPKRIFPARKSRGTVTSTDIVSFLENALIISLRTVPFSYRSILDTFLSAELSRNGI